MTPKDRLAEFLFERNYTINGHTKDDSLKALIRSLRPMDCGKPLIRLGSVADGGYLIPDDLEGIEYCFSPGVSTCADFENDIADRGIRSFLADASVERAPIERPEFVFDKKFLGATDNELTTTLATWKEKYLPGYTKDLLLQMDIEGSEWEVIANVPDALLKQFRIVIVEFHDLFNLYNPYIFKTMSSAFNKLTAHFHVAHIHPNNYRRSWDKRDIAIPQTLEITFYNKNRCPNPKPARGPFPHPLDHINKLDGPIIDLPKSWYSD